MLLQEPMPWLADHKGANDGIKNLQYDVTACLVLANVGLNGPQYDVMERYGGANIGSMCTQYKVRACCGRPILGYKEVHLTAFLNKNCI